MQEFEAKYLTDRPVKHRVEALVHTLDAAGFKVKSTATAKQMDTYLDSTECHIHRAGWSYRIRSTGQSGKTEHTLKRSTPGANGLFHRREIVQVCPDGCTLAAGSVAIQLSRLLPSGTAVQPRFQQSTERRNFRIKHPNYPGSRAVLSVDRVHIDNTDFNYAEIEVELNRGDPGLVREIARSIDTLEGFVTARMSKYDRARFCAESTKGATADGLDDTESWQQLAVQYLTRQMREIEHYEPFAWEGAHPEGVHRMRVATRRMRSALKWFSNVLPEEHVRVVRKDLRALTRRLGAIRDLDVHIASLKRAPDRYVLEVMKERMHARRRFTDSIKQGRLDCLREDFDRLRADLKPSDISIAEAMRTRVIPALGACVSLGSRIRLGEPKELHQLRLEIKDLNYVLEAAPTVIPAVGAAVTELQEVLGRHQDAQVALQRVAGHSGKRMQRLQDRYHERAMKARRELVEPWREFVHAVDALHASPRIISSADS